MENKIFNARHFTLVILLIGLASGASCETDSAAYQRGHAVGYQEGYQKGREGLDTERTQSYQDGFKAGFEAARPSAGTTKPAGVLGTVSIIVMILGMLKIIGSLVFFILILMMDSTLRSERIAKILATSLAALVVFWMSHISSVGVSERLANIVLKPAATTVVGKILSGVLAAALAWLALWLLERLVQASERKAELQTLLVFAASALVAVLIPFFVSLLSAPDINSYRFFDLIVGVVLGGVFWLVQRLLAESTDGPSIRRRKAYYHRVFFENLN
jgi:hypothetical protein